MIAEGLAVREVPWNDPAGAALRLAQETEVLALYGGEDLEPGPKPSDGDVTVFMVAFRDEVPVACGGLRALDAAHGEVKRMYVAPAHRGRGAADAVLDALEAAARERGWSRLVLETGTEQRAAIRFYERRGYRSIPRFGYYADSEASVCFEKRLRE